MRKSYLLAIFIFGILLLDFGLAVKLQNRQQVQKREYQQMLQLVEVFGLSDSAVTTEARYTRHPAVSDPVVPFMDHPGNIEHFPSGSFYRPVE